MITSSQLISLALSLGLADSRPAAGRAAAVVAPDAATEAAQSFWKEWVTAHKYRFLPSKDARVLLMVSESRSNPERVLDLIERALARVDAILPPVAPTTPATAPATPAPKPAASDKPRTWGAPDRPLDGDAIVLGVFRDPRDYASALDHLGKSFDYLASWLQQGKDDPGCILERPLFGACVDNVPGMEEWNPDNEVVHRTAQLAMLRRFGQPPVWVSLGVGWNVEFDVLRSIYCFPWRNSFVSVHEHGGWESDLRRKFGKKERRLLTIEDLASCKRGSFSAEQAAIAWGTIRFLADAYPQTLSPLLMELHTLRETLGRQTTAGKNGRKDWVMAADYELPAADQKDALARIVAPDVLEQASSWFELGKRWKRPVNKTAE